MLLTRSAGEIYRAAAERVANGMRYSCDAVYMESGPQEREAYAVLFRPPRCKNIYGMWGDHWGEDAVDCRVLALCFMAAIADSA